MKKYPYFLSLLLVLSICFNAQASISQESSFDEIRVSGKIHVSLQPGDTPSVEIPEAEDQISVEIRSGVLYLKRKEMWKLGSYKNSIEVVVHYTQIRSIAADAGAEVSSATPLLTADALRLSFGSGASADLEVKVDGLEVSVSEGANVELKGYTTELSAKANTGGILEAFDLQSERSYVKANTGGQAAITAIQLLEANANTGGQIDYRGNPQEVNTSKELGGRIDRTAM